MGQQTGLKGHLFALILGSATAGPLYGALRFALTRLCIDIPGIIYIAFLFRKTMKNTETDNVQSNLEKTDP